MVTEGSAWVTDIEALKGNSEAACGRVDLHISTVGYKS